MLFTVNFKNGIIRVNRGGDIWHCNAFFNADMAEVQNWDFDIRYVICDFVACSGAYQGLHLQWALAFARTAKIVLDGQVLSEKIGSIEKVYYTIHQSTGECHFWTGNYLCDTLKSVVWDFIYIYRLNDEHDFIGAGQKIKYLCRRWYDMAVVAECKTYGYRLSDYSDFTEMTCYVNGECKTIHGVLYGLGISRGLQRVINMNSGRGRGVKHYDY